MFDNGRRHVRRSVKRPRFHHPRGGALRIAVTLWIFNIFDIFDTFAHPSRTRAPGFRT